MPGLIVRLLNGNTHRFQKFISSKSACNCNVSSGRSVFTRQKSSFFGKEAKKIGKGRSSMNMKRPYRAVLIFLVGKSHCAEAVESLKEMIFCLARLLSRQCKVHTSQKVHRSLHLYSCYSRMWGEEMTRKMISEMRRSLMIGGKTLLMSAVFMMPYDWEKNKITDERLESCIKEYEAVDDLRRATVCCEECYKRQVIDKKIPDVDYCSCKGSMGYVDRSYQFDSWEAFLERKNILVWRRKHHVHSHLYSYKVYGTYDDLSLSAFMETQLNASFRTQWDSTALELKILNSDPESNSDLMYWLVKFPHFFANRDYIFKRRFRVDDRKKEVIILNEIAEHSEVPESKGIHRVKEYWSIMVLRAKDNFNELGMSYTLTYFDNPGTSLPSPVTNFVASTAFPDFLKKVYEAAMSLQRRWEDGEDVYVSLPSKLRYSREVEEEGVDLPVTEPESGDLVPFIEESDEKKTSRLMVEKAIQESQDGELVRDSIGNYKFPLRFRKTVIDLFEALELVSPEYEEKTALTAKLETTVDKLGLDKSRNQLVKRLESLRRKTKTFMTDAAKKKEESIKTMKEFERRKYYYEHTFPDETTLLLFAGLLKAVNDVLKADKDMRTGKGFAKATEERLHDSKSPPPKETAKKNCGERESFPTPEKDVLSNVSNIDALTPTVAFCEYCEHDSPVSNRGRVPAAPWYSFSFVFSWWWGMNGSDDERNESKVSCTCEYVTRRQNDSLTNTNNNLGKNESRENQAWYSFWFFSRSGTSEDLSKNGAMKNEKQADGQGIKCTTDDQGNESIPWYFSSWLFKLWTRANV